MTCRQLSRIQKFRKWPRKQCRIEDHDVEENYVEDKELKDNTVEDITYFQYFFENVINFIIDLNDNLF